MQWLAKHWLVLVENDSSLESCAQLSEFIGIVASRHEVRLQTLIVHFIIMTGGNLSNKKQTPIASFINIIVLFCYTICTVEI